MKRVAVLFVLLFIAFTLFACGQSEIVAVDLAFDLPEKFDVDEPFSVEGKKGVVLYADGSREDFSLREDHIVGFDSSTTGEKRAKLVYKGVEKEFSYRVEYASSPTKEILTDARVRIEKAASLNGTAIALYIDCGGLSGVDAVTFTLECDRTLDALPELTCSTAGWDVRAKEYTSAVKVVVFKRGGEPLSGDIEFLSVSAVGLTDGNFSLRDVVVTDGERDLDLPNARG